MLDFVGVMSVCVCAFGLRELVSCSCCKLDLLLDFDALLLAAAVAHVSSCAATHPALSCSRTDCHQCNSVCVRMWILPEDDAAHLTFHLLMMSSMRCVVQRDCSCWHAAGSECNTGCARQRMRYTYHHALTIVALARCISGSWCKTFGSLLDRHVRRVRPVRLRRLCKPLCLLADN